MAITETTTSTFKPIHCAWVALPTKQHLATDDTDQPGTGPDGWGLYEESEEGEGYFAWFHHQAEAENVVQQHNAAVADAEELETLRYEIGRLPIALTTERTICGTPFGTLQAAEVPGVTDRVVIPGPCLFCGLLRVRVEPAMVLLPGGGEEPARRVEMRRRSA